MEYKQIPRSAAPEGCQPLLRLMSVPGGASAGGGAAPACAPLIVFYFGGGPDNPAWSLLVNFLNAGIYDDSVDPVLLYSSSDDECPSRFIALDQWQDFLIDYDGPPM